MDKKRKRLLTMVSLVVVVILIGVVYYLVPQKKETTKSKTTQTATATAEPEITVSKVNTGDVVSISVTKNGKAFELVKKNEQWQFKGDKVTPLDVTKIEAMLKALSPLKAVKELSISNRSLNDFGLEKDSTEVLIKTKDNKSTKYVIGSKVPVVGGYYAYMGTSEKIYAFTQGFYDAFIKEKGGYMEVPTIPTITGSYITSLEVANNKAEGFKTKMVSDSKKVNPYCSWNIVKPYAEPIGVNASKLSELQNLFTTYKLSDAVEYGKNCYGKYGLDQPTTNVIVKYYVVKSGVTVKTQKDSMGNSTPVVEAKDRVDKEFVLYIGKAKDKDHYYVRISDCEGVFTMAKDLVDAYRAIDIFTYMDHCVYAILPSKMDRIDIKIGNNTQKITRKALKTTSADDTKEKNDWYLDGTKVPKTKESDFLMAPSKMFLLEYSGVASSTVKPTSKKPVISFTYYRGKIKDVVKYLPYDNVNFYQVEKNGTRLYLTDKRSVDDVIEKYKQIKSTIQ